MTKQKKQKILPFLILNKEKTIDVLNIANKTYWPLKGFLKEADFLNVLKNMRLKNNTVWPIPIVLDINKKEKQNIGKNKEILLKTENNQSLALLKNPQIYSYDKKIYCQKIFKTIDKTHPGVLSVFKKKEYLLGGEIVLLYKKKDILPDFYLTPKQTKALFKKKKWKKIVGFQTRNVPHRGHEFLLKRALQNADGIFIQPISGEKKETDFKDEFILSAYRLLIEKFFPKNKVVLTTLPLKMRYAGPREAIMHALIRKNFGCTHFIIGRDHAGVSNYYKPFAAQKIFKKFKPKEIGIEILTFNEVTWCPLCSELVFKEQCPHKNSLQFFSGTKIRNALQKNTPLPPYFLRPEIQQLLSNSPNPLVDNYYKNMQNNFTKTKKGKGFVLWFTGLSGSGKTAIAEKTSAMLKKRNVLVERLDGDIVRQSLTADLGFSKEDRDENIKRVGFVAELLSRNNIAVICSFITPYKEQRKFLKSKIKNFIEVFCDCPLKVCEKRDVKGLYQKAKQGLIPHFTGISDPYEKPENPSVILDTSIDGKKNIEKCAEQVIASLKKQNLI